MIHVGDEPDRSGRLAIVAGSGRLPQDVAEAAARTGENPLIIVLAGEATASFAEFDRVELDIGDFAGLITALRQRHVDRVVLSGGVHSRPLFRHIRPTGRNLLQVPWVIKTLIRGGDDTVLRMVIRLIESNGFKVIAAQEIVPDLVSEKGPMTRLKPTKAHAADMKSACQAALALGHLDIGQGAVSVGGRVVALEGPEGTDAMLRRVRDLRDNGRISQRRKGVLIKLCKPGQDERADLPTIGPSTVINAQAAGLAGIALEAGRSFVLEQADTIDRAEQAGLFIVGIDPTDYRLIGTDEAG